jgi:NAD(P)-dependent dehydrogenase (short-subunit alcohol dehydrogenase family)
MTLPTNSWILVTGANRGLGNSLCRKFLASNYNVAAVSRSGYCQISRPTGPADANRARVQDFRCDLARRDDVAMLIEEVSSLYLGAIVCNAATYTEKPFADCTVDEMQEVCEINAWSHLRLIKGLGDRLDRGSSIIFINSIGITMPADKEFAYLLSKKMAAAISDGIQFHFGKRGVSVMNVLLGGTNTDMAQGRAGVENFIDPDEAADAIVANVVLGGSVRCRTVELLRKKY